MEVLQRPDLILPRE